MAILLYHKKTRHAICVLLLFLPGMQDSKKNSREARFFLV